VQPNFDLLVADTRVLHLDRAQGRLERADILITGDRIVRLAPPGSVARDLAGEVIAAGGALAMPGLVNAHTHSPENLARGRAERARLSEWMEAVWPALDALPPEEIRLAIEIGAAEMIRHGVTSVVDHFRQTPMSPQALAVAVETYAAIGLRCTLAVMLRDAAGPGGLVGAPHVAKAPSAADQISLVAGATAWARQKGVVLAFGPSAPQRCSDALLDMIARKHQDLPVHTHVDETAEDAQAAHRRFSRTTVSQLDHIGLLGPKLACAHAVHVTPPDIDRLAATGTLVVHNPVSNLRLGSGIAPLNAFLGAGVAVALGTDGAASNDTQNPWEAIKLAAMLPRLSIEDAAAWPSAATVLELATRTGHRATGLAAAEPGAGTIVEQAPADLIVFDDDPLAQINDHCPQADLVFGSPSHRLRHVIARGPVLMRDRMLTTIDEDSLRRRLRTHRRELAA
jgi:cytosine/adenosine deaminase-related metal-dependent hydrolase